MTDLPCPICQSDNIGRGHTRHRNQKGVAMVPAVQCFECECVAPAEAWNNRSKHLLDLPQEARESFDRIIASLRYDGPDENSLTVGEIRRALP